MMDQAGPQSSAAEDAFEIGVPAPPWPQMSPKAFRGVSGDLVRAATAFSEADPVAVLVSHLVFAGAMFGRTKFVPIGDDEHHGRLFCAVVGRSALARKGASLSPVKKVWARVEDILAGEPDIGKSPCLYPLEHRLKIVRMLSSGEGLIYEIRDGSLDGDGNGDKGVEDKRLLVIETEFANCFRQMERKGNSLSGVLRQLWDGNDIGPSTKNDRVQVSSPHVSLIGHITHADLEASVNPVDLLNGFGNRILWVPVRRAKEVVFPKPMPPSEVDHIARELARVTIAAHTIINGERELTLGNSAHAAWPHYHRELNVEHPGLLGEVIARGTAQVMRLAAIFCLLDGASIIDAEHLEAAMAVWRYCFDGARMIFGERSISRDDDRVLDFLDGGSRSQTDIVRDVFKGNKSCAELKVIMDRLMQQGRVRCEKEIATGKGRPAIIWSRVR
jgi:hypothetical protein